MSRTVARNSSSTCSDVFAWVFWAHSSLLRKSRYAGMFFFFSVFMFPLKVLKRRRCFHLPCAFRRLLEILFWYIEMNSLRFWSAHCVFWNFRCTLTCETAKSVVHWSSKLSSSCTTWTSTRPRNWICRIHWLGPGFLTTSCLWLVAGAEEVPPMSLRPTTPEPTDGSCASLLIKVRSFLLFSSCRKVLLWMASQCKEVLETPGTHCRKQIKKSLKVLISPVHCAETLYRNWKLRNSKFGVFFSTFLHWEQTDIFLFQVFKKRARWHVLQVREHTTGAPPSLVRSMWSVALTEWTTSTRCAVLTPSRSGGRKLHLWTAGGQYCTGLTCFLLKKRDVKSTLDNQWISSKSCNIFSAAIPTLRLCSQLLRLPSNILELRTQRTDLNWKESYCWFVRFSSFFFQMLCQRRSPEGPNLRHGWIWWSRATEYRGALHARSEPVEHDHSHESPAQWCLRRNAEKYIGLRFTHFCPISFYMQEHPLQTDTHTHTLNTHQSTLRCSPTHSPGAYALPRPVPPHTVLLSRTHTHTHTRAHTLELCCKRGNNVNIYAKKKCPSLRFACHFGSHFLCEKLSTKIFATDKVYIAGGFNGQECLSSAESYSPSTNQWTLIQNMRNRRSGVGVIAHDNCLFAIGGFNGITRMNNGERFNPQTNQWTNISEMYSPRSNFGIEVKRIIS